MNEAPPVYDVEELTLEEAVLLLATDEEKHSTDYRKSSMALVERLVA